jgi:drug/metabolite transporter (DMT)-like permease
LPQQANYKTYLALIAAMFMWGGTWVAGRIIAQEVAAPLAIAAIRFVIAALALALFALLREGSIPRLQTSREWGIVTGLAFTGIFIYGLCFFYGLKYVPAGRGALVVALNPVIVALAAWFLGQEK